MTSDLVERHPLKEKRRANKPLLERKRRARINDSLSDLKHLVLASLNKDVSKFTKMEKVDILDMTVQFLKGQRFENRKDDYATVYRAGYSECTKELYQHIMTMDGVDHNLKCRILSDIALNKRSERMSPPPSPTLSNSSPSPIPSPTGSPIKPCISSIFIPTTGHSVENSRIIVPMVTPSSNPAVLNNNEHYIINKYRSPENTYKSVGREIQQRYIQKDIRLINKNSNVWRPW